MIAAVVDKPLGAQVDWLLCSGLAPLVAPHPADPGSAPYHVTSSTSHGAFKSIAEYNFKKVFIKIKPEKHIFFLSGFFPLTP